MKTNQLAGRLAVLWMVATLIFPTAAAPQSSYDGPLIETHAHIVHYRSLAVNDDGTPVGIKYRVDAIDGGTDGTTAQEYVENLDRNNIKCTVGFHAIAIDDDVTQEELRQHAEKLLDLYPNRFILFAEIFGDNPLTWFDATKLELLLAEGLYLGFGEIQFANSPLSDDTTDPETILVYPNDGRLMQIYGVLGGRGLFVMAHPASREFLNTAISALPGLTWIIHGPHVHNAWSTTDTDGDGIPDGMEKLEGLLDSNPNLYYTIDFFESLRDIINLKQAGSATAFLKYMKENYDDLLQQMVDTWKDVIERHPDRFMWGTDMANHEWQWSSPEVIDMISTFSRDFIGQLEATAGENYAYKNAESVFGKCDEQGGEIQFSSASYGVDEGVGEATITVERTGLTTRTVTVDCATSDGTATAGEDYESEPASGTLTFEPGETTKTFTVTIVDDSSVEAQETINLTLSNPTRGATLGATSTALLEIANNDVAFRFKDATYSVSEGEVTGTATIRVEKLGGTPGTVSIDYKTSNGTATSGRGGDYIGTLGTLSFGPGDPGVKTFEIPILNDTIPESHETVNLALSNPVNPDGSATVTTPSTAVLTIINDDVTFRFSSASYSVSESAGEAVIVVERLGETEGTVSVSFATSDGTAIGDFQPDYTPVNRTLTFSPGEFAKTIQVSIVNDSVVEDNETVNLTLSNPQNPNGSAVLDNPSTSVLTIVNDDVAFRFLSASYSMTETGGPAIIEVEKLGGTPGVVSVDFATSGGTATAGVDYQATSGTLFFGPADPPIKAFEVPILHDTIPEPHETVNLALSNPQNPTGDEAVTSPGTAVLTIFNDDVAFRFDSATYSVGEADGDATITVQRLGATPPGVSVSVEYATVGGGTATAGSDYDVTSGRLIFGPGEREKPFTVPILNDTGPEDHETVNLLLRDPVNPSGTAALATLDTAVLTILNDDVVFHFSRGAYMTTEGGTALIQVNLIGATADQVSVDYATSDGTARAGSDYDSASEKLTFTTGEKQKTFEVTTLDDSTSESSETVILTLSNPRNSNPGGTARLGGPSTATLRIIDNDLAFGGRP